MRSMRQAQPKGDSPNKAWNRKRPTPKRFQKSGKDPDFGREDLPKRVTQNRAKPGMTSPQ